MFTFNDLDAKTRGFMMEAINDAEKTGNIYYSKRFNAEGNSKWLPLLKKAAQEFNEHWLAFQLQANVLMVDFEGAQRPTGGYSIKHIPHTAAETLADGQFNRFYMLGLCRRAKSENIDKLVVYRAKDSRSSRSESELLIGKSILVSEIEKQLSIISDSFKSPLLQPNSGLSIKIS